MDRTKFPEKLFVFTGSLIFFLFTLATNFSGPHDSIGYLNGIVRGEGLPHAHHLLYHYSAHYWLQVTQAILPGVKDYYLVESFTALCGSGSVVFIYSFFRFRFRQSLRQSLINTAVIVFSYGMWFYSVNIEVYAAPMLLLLACLYILTKPTVTKKDLWLAALLHSFAILYGQFHILFTPVLLYVIWRQRATIKFIPALIQYALIGIILVGGTYFLLGWFAAGQNSIASWSQWFRGYTTSDTYWQPLSVKTPLRVFTGFSHAFVGGHFIFRIPGLSRFMENTLASHSLEDELFLARHISGATALFLTGLTTAVGILVLALIIRFVRRFRIIHEQLGGVVMPLLVAGAVYSAFFLIWMPEILEFWIFQMVLLWLLLLGTLSITGFPFRIKPMTGTIFMAVSLFLINYLGSVRWLKHIEYDWYYTRVQPVKEVATSKDLILLQEGWILWDFARYFTKAKVIGTPNPDSTHSAVDNLVNETLSGGGRIFVYPDQTSSYSLVDPVYIDSLLKQHATRQQLFNPSNPTIILIEGK